MKNLKLASLSLLIALQGHSQTRVSQGETLKVPQKVSQYTSSTSVKTNGVIINKSDRPLRVEDLLKTELNKKSDQQDFLIRKSFQQGKFGGGDAGGGNLIQGKPIESYAIDVSKMPEMQMATEWVKQISDSQFPSGGLKEEVESIVKSKVWYLVPLKLPTLSNSTVGTPFAIEQGALQDFDEVWIEKASFLAMAEKERIQLLVHEIFIGLKIFARESFYTQCRISESFASSDTTEECMALKPFTSRRTLDLSPLDYADVRRAVKITLDNKEILTQMARGKFFGEEYYSSLRRLSQEVFGHGRFDTYYKSISTSTISVKSFSDQDIAFAIIDKNAAGLPKYCNHKVVEDLGQHRFRVKAQSVASYGLDTKKNGVISLRMQVQDMSGKVLTQNMYTPISEDGADTKLAGPNNEKEKQDLTLNCGIEGCSYTQAYMTRIKEIKNSRSQAGLMILGLTGSTINRITFATWNIRNLETNSFNDVRDVYHCLDNSEYICAGPECLHNFTK